MINTASSDKKISSIVANAAVKSGAAFPLKGAKQAQKVKEFSKKDQVDLFRGLGSMLRAQINTADALKYYGHGLPNKMISAALAQIREDINAGINVHEAFRRTGRFSETIIGLIQAGSDAGQLHHAFQALASRLKSSLHFEKQIKKATITPCVIICVLMGAFIVAQVKIVPQVEEMLGGVGAKPDGMTALSFKVSHFTQAVWPVFVIGLIAVAITIFRSSHVRNVILGFVMSKWRLMRLLIMSLRQVTFLSTIQLLHSNGINLAKSIRVSANSVKNTPFYQELRNAADKYEHSGVPLSTAFAKYTSVDAQVSHMLSIGEKSASLDAQLGMLCEMYEEDLQNHMSTFAATVSFIVLLMAVALIAAVFIGTFLPIFLMGPKMMQSGM
ncbi:MAG: type II secretion system F family protein [Akkermansiaceae bacterium]|jgi:type II secretory pathway component PulF|nr:type II secretion system F family protein [Akkermansiaceae bacterium]MBJ7395479.1 type II secretion system F family protein [Akkermansiaceae bacterium]MBJ7422955.1 type II secretion system F family protein [Akkermansiaceae bacterium]